MILEESYRMSAVLARKVLQDLLKDYAKLDDYKLEKAIARFIEDTQYPKTLRENTDYIRTLANMGAHTKTAMDGQVLEATKEEAEWTLKVIADMFHVLHS
jgi:hypothetical protein